MKFLPTSIQTLIREFNKLPGIGAKTSERFVYHLLRQPKADIESLSQSLSHLKDKIRLCTQCSTYTEDITCSICRDPQRDHTLVCVVAEPKDVMAIEKTSQFAGVYHVLGGVITPSEGIGPEQLRVQPLLERVKQNTIQEIILATNPDMEGEATALYLDQQLKPTGVRVTRIARGLPMGADIEFADEVTLANALEGRQQMK